MRWRQPWRGTIGGIAHRRQPRGPRARFAFAGGAKYKSTNAPSLLVPVSDPAAGPAALAPASSSNGLRTRAQGPVRLRTLVLIRWLAISGQTAALLLVYFGFGYELPLEPAMTVVAMSTALNVLVSIRYPSSYRLGDGAAALFLLYDTLQLALLLYLTGGLANPFSLLLLAPVAVSATILSLRSTLVIGLLAMACITILALFHYPLPWAPEGLDLPHLYLYGQWVAMAVGVAFLGAYLWRLAAETRRMTDALVATQISLAREQRLSALGGLAAAAAHELGTPLGTITMAATEMVRAVPAGSELASDAELISSEARRCREILGRIAKGPERESEHQFHRQGFASMLREAAAHQHRDGVKVSVEVEGGQDLDVIRRPEVVHGLTNLIENAVDFARSRVMIEAEAGDREIRIRVLDDGPGFPHDVLGALGEPYISSRSGGEGLGLGVFISKTLLERTGGLMTVSNRIEGGARVEIVWPRAALESRPEKDS